MICREVQCVIRSGMEGLRFIASSQVDVGGAAALRTCFREVYLEYVFGR